jgi:hypothetical protein
LVLKMLEMQRNRMLMYTSCGWFFDDITGLESVQILRYAARVLQIAYPYEPDLKEQFLRVLGNASSNVKPPITGAELFDDKIIPQVAGLDRVAAHVAISYVFEEMPSKQDLYCYTIKIIDSTRERSGDKTLLVGRMMVLNTITTESQDLIFAVVHHGGVDLRCSVSDFLDHDKYDLLKQDLVNTFRLQSSTDLIRKLDRFFPTAYYRLRDLFVDRRRELIETATRKMYEDEAATFEEFYQKTKDLAGIIKSHEASLPDTFMAAARFVLNRSLLSELEKLSRGFYPDEFHPVLAEAKFWNIHLDLTAAAALISDCVLSLVGNLAKKPDDTAKMKEILQFLDLGKDLDISLDLSESQIAFFRIAQELQKSKAGPYEHLFKEVAQRLAVRLETAN